MVQRKIESTPRNETSSTYRLRTSTDRQPRLPRPPPVSTVLLVTLSLYVMTPVSPPRVAVGSSYENKFVAGQQLGRSRAVWSRDDGGGSCPSQFLTLFPVTSLGGGNWPNFDAFPPPHELQFGITRAQWCKFCNCPRHRLCHLAPCVAGR